MVTVWFSFIMGRHHKHISQFYGNKKTICMIDRIKEMNEIILYCENEKLDCDIISQIQRTYFKQ